MIEARARTEISEWIVRAALAGATELEVVTGVCEQLSRAGVALVRCSVATSLLDPTIDARGVRWYRGQGAHEEAQMRPGETGASHQ